MRLSLLLLLASALMSAQAPRQATGAIHETRGSCFDLGTGAECRHGRAAASRERHPMRADPAPGDLVLPLSYRRPSTPPASSHEDVEPGEYRMTAQRNGFASLAYGARGPCGRARPSPSPGRST